MSKSHQEIPATVGRPVCEFYTHFTDSTAYPDPKKSETYHRSAKKELPPGEKTSDLSFSGNQASITNGSAPKTGNFYSPFHFSAYKKTVVFDGAEPPQKNFKQTALPYDVLLRWQKNLARHAVDTLKRMHPKFKANQDNEYPCLLFCVGNKKTDKNPEIWSKFVMRYVIAFANVLSAEAGLNLELVARSSFDCLRPSISPCGDSVRVSFGLSPRAYVDIVCEAVALAHTYLQEAHFSSPVDAPKLRNALQTYNKKRKLSGKNAVVLGASLWESLWLRGDAKGCSFATQLFRTAVSSDALTRRITKAALKDKKSLREALKKPTSRAEILAAPLQAFFQAISVVNSGDKSTISVDNDANKTLLEHKMSWLYDNISWDEQDFLDILEYFLSTLNAPKATQKKILNASCLGEIYPLLERILWERCHHLPKSLHESSNDGYGSDSDTEWEPEEGFNESTPPPLFAKKFITATGMRAIQLCFAAGKIYLEQNHNVDVLKIGFTAEHMYYETEEALSSFPIPVSNNKAGKHRKECIDIPFVDVNHCNTAHGKALNVLSDIPKNALLCVLDITSATTQEIRQHISKLFCKRETLDAILLISSALKNQQGMSDCNPFGEIRIFAKTKASRDILYSALEKLENQARYAHPKESHAIRKHYKALGLTLSNAGIFASAAPENALAGLQNLESSTPKRT